MSLSRPPIKTHLINTLRPQPEFDSTNTTRRSLTPAPKPTMFGHKVRSTALILIWLLALALSMCNALAVPEPNKSASVGPHCPAHALPNRKSLSGVKAGTAVGTTNHSGVGSTSHAVRRMENQAVPVADQALVNRDLSIGFHRLQIIVGSTLQLNMQGSGLDTHGVRPNIGSLSSFWGNHQDTSHLGELSNILATLRPVLQPLLADQQSRVEMFPVGSFKASTWDPLPGSSVSDRRSLATTWDVQLTCSKARSN